ncbi:Na+/H+ antiporter NhaA [Gordonia sp. X0973]|uniref:Na+/H+ antiporter NhaA n=1 Tax=Gordonia sp. X0973 TaxID=2742602 RepID=UPI000F51C858|nr:Na+/H+ antiporter NhaA [Gordonia sp. X0973]QKT06381.1 Na+/H+ antiporter NhaA [Gordonia sp. X0973]
MSTADGPEPQSFPPSSSTRETLRIAEILRKETVGGFLLVGAAVVALIVANSPLADAYEKIRGTVVGYAPWHLDLSMEHWAADGLLAIFFFLVGLELKREIVDGELRSPRTALVPVIAAIGGVIVPALIYFAINRGGPGAHGWAIPTATDIAFAVAVLAVVGSRLPSSLRLFLLTLAVVDDLIAIVIIAVVYTDKLDLPPLLFALIPLAAFAFAAHRYADWFAENQRAAWLVLLPLGVLTWGFVHASGIHSTIAGVLLGFAVPVLRGSANHPDDDGLAAQFEHRFRPLSAGFAVPVFAFFSAGVSLGGSGSPAGALTDPIAVGIMAGLLLGKPIGIFGTTWLTLRLSKTKLGSDVRWIDVFGVSVLAGIGFTVSLLVAELTFDADPASLDHAKIAILLASTTAAVLAGVLLALRNRRH